MTFIDRRASKRIPVSIEAKLVIDRVHYAAFIQNVSETGISTIVAPVKASVESPSHSPVEIKFKTPSGKNFHLYCTKKWTQIVSTHGLTKKIGMQIIAPPAHYKEYIFSLKMQHMNHRSAFPS